MFYLYLVLKFAEIYSDGSKKLKIVDSVSVLLGALVQGENEIKLPFVNNSVFESIIT